MENSIIYTGTTIANKKDYNSFIYKLSEECLNNIKEDIAKKYPNENIEIETDYISFKQYKDNEKKESN